MVLVLCHKREEVMKFIRLLIIYVIPLSAAVSPIEKATHDFADAKNAILRGSGNITENLLDMISTLQRQQKEADAQKSDFLDKQKLVDASTKALINAKNSQNKSLPQEAQAIVQSFYSSAIDLMTQMNTMVTKGVNNTQNVQILVPDIIAKIKNAIPDIDKYVSLIRDSMNQAATVLKPQLDAEIAGKIATQQAKKAAQTTPAATPTTPATPATPVAQPTTQAAQQVTTQSAKIEKGLQAFGKILGIGGGK